MKPILTILVFVVSCLQAFAQKFDGLDKSPMDMVYYPNNFAHDRKFSPELIGDVPATVRIIYSRPAKKDREVFGKLVPFGKVWRVGANEAPEIKFYRDLTIGGKPIKAGTYALLAIPEQNEWTIILSTDLDQWGAYSYQEGKDVLRFKVPVKTIDQTIENFSIKIEKAEASTAVIRMAWDRTMVEIPIGL